MGNVQVDENIDFQFHSISEGKMLHVNVNKKTGVDKNIQNCHYCRTNRKMKNQTKTARAWTRTSIYINVIIYGDLIKSLEHWIVWVPLFIPRKAGYCNHLRVFVCFSVCLFVCLFVCLLAGFLMNYWSDFDEFW